MALSKTTLAQRPGPSPRVPGPAAQRAEQQIRHHLARVEQFIHQQRPEKALALLQAPGTPPSSWPLLWHPGWYLFAGWAMLQQNQPKSARAAFTQGLKALQRLMRRPSAARRPFLGEWREWLHHFLGMSFCLDEQPIQALFYYRRGLRAIGDGVVRDPKLMMLIHKGMGEAYLTLGLYAEAIAFFTQAKHDGQDVCTPHDQGLIEWGLGRAYKFQGNLTQASSAFSQALHIFERLDAKPLVAQLQSLLGLMQIWSHHQDEAEVLLRQALGTARRTGDLFAHAIASGNVAALYLAQGKVERALHTAQETLALLQETHNQDIMGYLYLTLARIFESQSNLAATEEALTSAIMAFQQTQHYGLLVRARERYSTFLAKQGRFQEAYEQLLMAPYKTAASLSA
ncbi:MAG TPA: hypothetical protein VKT82_05230 [Ktedonobacterales bacterium]|nr:hypothetical protein [Ktedonobacterales bacterium]